MRVSPTGLPLLLYGVNGMFPVLICAGRGMWGAVVFGSLAMAIPLGLAVRSARAPAVADRRRPTPAFRIAAD